MASWIKQTFELDDMRIVLTSSGVTIIEDKTGREVNLKPITRDEANQMSVSLKLAAARLEGIGKVLPNKV